VNGEAPLLARLHPKSDLLGTAILETVAYADVFDYAVTVQEIHRYLVACATDLGTVQQVLEEWLLPSGEVENQDGCIFLPGRQALVPLRQRRAHIAQSLWQHAWHYGAWIARLPFVRMVAVTGALAVNNVDDDADIDYLIVTEPERLWLCRALVIALVRWAARRGHVVCPNYFLSERALVVYERNLYTARELAQMVPLAGLPVYERMRQLNPWVDELLPNAKDPPKQTATVSIGGSNLSTWIEYLLRSPVGDRIETWEMQRKIRKFQGQRSQSTAHGEATFCADWCKGHFDGHAQAILDAFSQRLDHLSGRPTQPERLLRQER
jgi:hypothetical protein